MGYITIDILTYVLLSVIVLAILLLIWNIKLELRLKRLMRGKAGNSLEASFKDFDVDIKDLQKFRKELEEYLLNVEKRLKRSVQGVSNINFSAFSGADSGAKSFANAFVNEHGDGIIISSLNARDRLSVFTKEVKGWKTERELSEEEQTALTKAKQSCSL